MTDSVLIRLHGFHALHGYHSATVRLVDENGSAVLEGKCTGTGHEGFQLFADSNGDFPACEYVLSVSYDLLVELTVDDKPTVAALVSAPHTSTVIHRKIVPRLVNTDHGAVAITFVVSPKDQDGYRTRLTTLLQMVDPSSVDSVPDVMASMSEPAAFSFAWREYGTTDLPFEDRARTLARRYAIDVTEFLEKVEAAEPETLLTLFVEQLLLHHAVLESQDQMPAQRVIGLIRKYGLNEEEVTAALDEAEDREEFIEELRDAFGPEPRLNDPVHAIITNRIAPHSAVPAVATTVAAASSDVEAAHGETQHQHQPPASASHDHDASDAEHGEHQPAATSDRHNSRSPSGSDAGHEHKHGDGDSPRVHSDHDGADREKTPLHSEGDHAATPREGDESHPAIVATDSAEPENEAAAAAGHDTVAHEQSESAVHEPPRASNNGGPCDVCAELKSSLLAIGRERDAKETDLCELRDDYRELSEQSSYRIRELQTTVSTLNEAIEGYRESNDALRGENEARKLRAQTLEAQLYMARERVDQLVRDTARLVAAREVQATRIRLTVKFGTAEMCIPVQTNVAIGDLRKAVLQRAVRLGSLTQAEADSRNLQLFAGAAILYDDDTLEEMGIESSAEVLTLTENAAVSLPPRSAGASPTHYSQSAVQQQQPQQQQPLYADPEQFPLPIAPREFIVRLDKEQAESLESHESLERRLAIERERMAFDNIRNDEKRAFEHCVKRILDLSRMKLVDRAAYARTEEERSYARNAISRIDSALRAGLTVEAMLGVARHAELTASAMETRAVAEKESAAARQQREGGGVIGDGDVDFHAPNEMAQRVEKRRQQCVADLKEMIDTLQRRVAVRPDRLSEAEGLVSKARSYVSLASSLSVEELQTCLRETVAFVTSCRK
jgi:hypothetical protein